MKNYLKCFFIFCLSASVLPAISVAAGFFEIQSVKFFNKPSNSETALYTQSGGKNRTSNSMFLPFLKVTARTKRRIRADNLYVKAYYYDRARNLIEQSDKPYPVKRESGTPHPLPVFFSKTSETLYFAVPTNILAQQQWHALVVFGDKHEADAATYPRGLATSFSFPESKLVFQPDRIQRKAAMDPVIEHVVKTRNNKQPQITLFMRPPKGMTDASEAKGVLAMCLLAGNVGEIKRRLQELDAKDDVGGILRFAEKHKLVILCWGSRSLWNPRASWDEQTRQVNKEMDETFDDVAKAWAKGVEELSRKYGIPENGFLLWGVSGSAQYAARLALRQPQYFLAVHVHVPSSFDMPTREANSVLWCLTTGENESGYERSLRFLSACRELGYPIIYKAVPGLGHAGHPLTDKLGLVFFEYALSLREEKAVFENETNDFFRFQKTNRRKNQTNPGRNLLKTRSFTVIS